MNPRVVVMGLLCLVVSFSTISGACVCDFLAQANESSVITLELLQAEELDTVSLDQPVHFVTPEVTDAVAGVDIYHVIAAGPDRLKLIPPKSKPPLTVEALITNHTEVITTPIALYVRDDAKFPHVLLLLPGGSGLEAIGSYDVTRTRGMSTIPLTRIQIQGALKNKLRKKHKAP